MLACSNRGALGRRRGSTAGSEQKRLRGQSATLSFPADGSLHTVYKHHSNELLSDFLQQLPPFPERLLVPQ